MSNHYIFDIYLLDKMKRFCVPQKANPNAIGYDLRAAEDCIIESYTAKLVPNGIVLRQGSGENHLYFQICSRSGLALNKNLFVLNAPGIIDPDYCGPNDEIKTLLFNLSNSNQKVKEGDRISQLIPMLVLNTVKGLVFNIDDLENTIHMSRGGFGSTGR